MKTQQFKLYKNINGDGKNHYIHYEKKYSIVKGKGGCFGDFYIYKKGLDEPIYTFASSLQQAKKIVLHYINNDKNNIINDFSKIF